MALPKHKVYKGAPNFVYAVYSADQILDAMPPEQRSGLSASSFKQCAAAPPQLPSDVAAGVAYFVCDVGGPRCIILCTRVQRGLHQAAVASQGQDVQGLGLAAAQAAVQL